MGAEQLEEREPSENADAVEDSHREGVATAAFIVEGTVADQTRLRRLLLSSREPPSVKCIGVGHEIASSLWHPPFLFILPVTEVSDTKLNQLGQFLAIQTELVDPHLLLYIDGRNLDLVARLFAKGATSYLLRESSDELLTEQLNVALRVARELSRADLDRRRQRGSWH